MNDRNNDTIEVKNNTDRKKPSHILLKLIGIAAAAFIILAVISFPLRTVNYTITTDEISASIRIAQISDLHGCYYGKNMETLINAVSEADPDIVVMTGDIYDDLTDNTNSRIFLSQISEMYPCYYVSGNHEKWSGQLDIFTDELISMDITVLEGENIQVDEMMLCGAAPSSDGSLNFADSVMKCAESAKGYAVLLAHYPEQIDYYRSFGKFDLVLSGHAHGGQWRIPYLINGLYAPNQGLFPDYAGGYYSFDDCTMIVSRGLSRTKEIIPRIMNNPELVIIDIEGRNEE